MSRRAHIIEAVFNTASGFIISLVFTYILLGLLANASREVVSVVLVGALTIVSIARNYFWRRFFHNAWWTWLGLEKWRDR